LSRIAFLFPGQGAQVVGMGRALVEAAPAAQSIFDRGSAVLGYDVADICWQGPAGRLDSTIYSQPALFVTSMAALEYLRSKSPEVVDRCLMAAGLSLGEYTAMTFAGVMDFETGLRVVQQRGQAMQGAADARPSSMISILGLDIPRIEQLCDEARGATEVLQIANYLCPGNTVVSGDTAACQRLSELAESAGAMKVIPLAVAGAFHTSLMASAVDGLTAALANARLSKPRLAVVSNVDAQVHTDPEEIRELLIRQVVSPVRWESSMRKLLADGCDEYWEVGPGRVLTGLLKRIDRKIKCENVAC
jgi:[acyl-carrier-protein] S-malonyltransferase